MGKYQKPYSTIYRVMHWLMALSFVALLFTIFLRLTWLNKYNIADIIGPYLLENDIELSQDQLIVLAKKIRKPMWQWHIYLGYFITALFIFRFSLPFFGKMKIQNPRETKITIKEKAQRWTYILFYIFVFVSIVTGILIENGPKDYKKNLESIHNLGLYYLIPFIAIHLISVFRMEFNSDKGIVSRIISGSDAYKNKK
jgi:cytochrome b561